jgi:hypothetical protein
LCNFESIFESSREENWQFDGREGSEALNLHALVMRVIVLQI